MSGDGLDEPELRQGRHAVIEAYLLDDLAVLEFKDGRPGELQPAPIRLLIDRALQLYRELGRNGFRATSFGFDFPVLTDVFDVPSNGFVLRIAPSDEPALFMAELAGFVAQAWRERARDPDGQTPEPR
jgi:hypothetical protein